MLAVEVDLDLFTDQAAVDGVGVVVHPDRAGNRDPCPFALHRLKTPCWQASEHGQFFGQTSGPACIQTSGTSALRNSAYERRLSKSRLPRSMSS